MRDGRPAYRYAHAGYDERETAMTYVHRATIGLDMSFQDRTRDQAIIAIESWMLRYRAVSGRAM
jgi:hypothetical protein